MTHKLTFLERWRVRLAAALHGPLSAYGLYAESRNSDQQYALTIDRPYAAVEHDLHHLDFIRNIGSSLKSRSGSLPSDVSVASWAYYPDGILTSDYQLHLDLYIGPDDQHTDVYAHWEPSWVRHPVRHYSGNEVDNELGVDMIRNILSESYIQYTVQPPADRAVPEVVLPGPPVLPDE